MHTSTSTLAAAFALAAAAASLAACDTSPPAPPGAIPPAPAQIQIKEVTWPAEATIDRASLAALSPEARERVNASRVPVLVPPRASLLAGAKVISKETWTVASMRAEDATITITASRAARVVPGVGPAEGNRPIRGTRGFVTQNEGIWGAAWRENGVSYSVEVECASPEAARCADGAFVTELAGELTFVGGAGAGEVAR